ncbi:MAG: alpha-E domain-containing protein [Halothiobacillaceae bacterium]
MLSRVAENIYWLARYIERAEDTARLISVSTHLLLDFPATDRLDWDSLIDIFGNKALFEELYGQNDQSSVLSFLCGDRRHGSSILSSLAMARENLRMSRDVMPREAWEEVNQLYLDMARQYELGITPRNRDRFLKRVIRSCQTVTGLIDGSLSHTQVRRFLLLGSRLERSDMTTRIIDVRSANLLPHAGDDLQPFESLQWMSLLKSVTGYQMYRQQVRLRVRGPDVLRFLLQDTAFPRSVACSLQDFLQVLKQLPEHEQVQAVAEDLARQLTTAQIESLARNPEQLNRFVDQLQVGSSRIHDALASRYFS